MAKKLLAVSFVLLFAASAVSAGMMSDLFGMALGRVTGAAVAPAMKVSDDQFAPDEFEVACIDPDGTDLYVPGKVRRGSQSFKDSCVSNKGRDAVTEYYCREDGSVGSVMLGCPASSQCMDDANGAGFCRILCSDVDNKDIYTGSVAVGYDADSNEIISKPDSCLDDKRIFETYCMEDGSVSTALLNCPMGTVCNMAGSRCESSVPVSVCQDSDGFDLEVKGVVRDGVHIKYDSCAMRMSAQDLNYQSVDGCSGDDCYVKEAFCQEMKNGGERLSVRNLKCGYGCSGGECLDEPADDEGVQQPQGSCIDSDGGRNYDVKGQVKYGQTLSTDTCLAGSLEEFYCDGIRMSERKACESGCLDGRCLAPEGLAPRCRDSDGDDKYVQGMAATSAGETFYDSCMGESQVTEYYCSEGVPLRRVFGCEVACMDGACDRDCVDSDGNDASAGGVVTTPASRYVDECDDDMGVIEYTCLDGVPAKERIACVNGCKSGVCVAFNDEQVSQPMMCQDSDDGDIYVKGRATLYDMDYVANGYSEDICNDEFSLMEASCHKTTTIDGVGTEAMLDTTHRCDLGCEDGACVKPAEEGVMPSDVVSGDEAPEVPPSPEVHSSSPVCGDGVCDPNEDAGICSRDCGPSRGTIRDKIRDWIRGLA